MQKLHFSINIDAPVEKVWDTMLADTTYRKWTSVFSAGSYYKGSWEEGSKILFIGPSKDGKNEEGMVSRIKTITPHKYISIEHLGYYSNGREDYTSEEVKKWLPSFENYTFTAVNGGTELLIDMDSEDKYVDMFKSMWPKALHQLKLLSENKG